MQQRTPLYLDDLEPGQRFCHGDILVTEEAIIAFARDYDPQPFHTDPAAATGSFFQGLAASGWHTASLTMRLLVEGGPCIVGGLVGAGVDHVLWPQATRPGDRLSIACEVLDLRPSRSRPSIGIMRLRTTTTNQHGQTVMVLIGNLVVPRRPSSSSPASHDQPASQGDCSGNSETGSPGG